MKTGLVVSGVVGVAALFWLSPRLQPYVLAARHAERFLGVLAPDSKLPDPALEAAREERIGRAIRGERSRCLSAIPSLGHPAFTLVRVRRSSSETSKPSVIEVDRPRGTRFRGGEPVVCGDAIVGLAEKDADDVPSPIGRIRLLTHPDSRFLGAVQPARVGGPIVLLLVGGAASGRSLRVRYAAEEESLADGTIVRTAPENAEVPAGLAIGRLSLRRDDRTGRVRERLVAPEVDPSRQVYLAVLDVARAGSDGSDAQAFARALDSDDSQSGLGEAHRRVDARVIAAGDASPGRLTLLLDVGTEARVEPGCAVSLGRTLVGRVLRAGPRACQVVATGDPEFRARVLALAASSLDAGSLEMSCSELRGASDPRGTSFRCEPSLDASAGAELVTAPGEPSIPSGLLVGVVASTGIGSVRIEDAPRASIGDPVSVWVIEEEP